MPIIKRTGTDNRIIVRNSKVYAAPVQTINTFFNGLFAYRDLEIGEILVQYEGDILTPNSDTVVRKTIDGQGELMGFANHAPKTIANAEAVDMLPTIIDNDIPYTKRHALVLVAKQKIAKGTEIRFSYNEDDDGEMVKMMKKKGITQAQINDRTFLKLRYVTPPERNHAGIVEKDFPFDYIGDL